MMAKIERTTADEDGGRRGSNQISLEVATKPTEQCPEIGGGWVAVEKLALQSVGDQRGQGQSSLVQPKTVIEEVKLIINHLEKFPFRLMCCCRRFHFTPSVLSAVQVPYCFTNCGMDYLRGF